MLSLTGVCYYSPVFSITRRLLLTGVCCCPPVTATPLPRGAETSDHGRFASTLGIRAAGPPRRACGSRHRRPARGVGRAPGCAWARMKHVPPGTSSTSHQTRPARPTRHVRHVPPGTSGRAPTSRHAPRHAPRHNVPAVIAAPPRSSPLPASPPISPPPLLPGLA